MTDDLLKQGIAALNAGRTAEARRLLVQVVQQDERNEMGWLWLSGAVDTDEGRCVCLENVLAINPGNEAAQRGIKVLRNRSKGLASTLDVVSREGKVPLQPIAEVEKEPRREKRYQATGYIEQDLMSDEWIAYRTRLHWVLFLGPVTVGLAGALAIIPFFAAKTVNDPSTATCCIGPFLLLLALLSGISAVVTYMTSEFAVTNKRVLFKMGFIRRRSLDLMLAKVEAIGINQSVLGRLLGYGTVVITGTGGVRQPFKNVVNPLELRRQVQKQISA